MAERFDVLLRGGVVVDPVNGRHGRFDVAVGGGKIAAVGEELDAVAAETIDVEGLTVVPGLIDLHVHVSAWLGGKFGHRMMALAGVTTALDVSGPIDSVVDIARDFGVGLNLACVNYVRPGHTVDGQDPGVGELEALLDHCLAKGALGFKILGGHYPLTPEATARVIRVAGERGAYLAFHAGTLATGSNIEGVAEAAELAAGNPMHLAHVNSYCRGKVRPAVSEGEEALAILEGNPNICSESYLATINGTSAKCSGGVPESNATKACLIEGGFAVTEKGMEDAIFDGWALLNMAGDGATVLGSGVEAVKAWRAMDTDGTVSFRVNPPEPRLRLATAKRPSGAFAVDCLATDGGGIPRNETVRNGLALVHLEALSMEGFVTKASVNPARILGLGNKGHLGVGADADITVLDVERLRPEMTMAQGRMIMREGHVSGSGTRMITTAAGEATVRAAGLDALVVDPATAPFCRRP
jgi:cytosine/adenosine deaminase-related metal-dependent hydrolase